MTDLKLQIFCYSLMGAFFLALIIFNLYHLQELKYNDRIQDLIKLQSERRSNWNHALLMPCEKRRKDALRALEHIRNNIDAIVYHKISRDKRIIITEQRVDIIKLQKSFIVASHMLTHSRMSKEECIELGKEQAIREMLKELTKLIPVTTSRMDDHYGEGIMCKVNLSVCNPTQMP